MMPARSKLFALLTLVAISLAAGRAAATVVGVPLTPAADGRLVLAQILVDEMPPDMRTAYIRGIQ